MEDLHISTEELEKVRAACHWIRISGPAPPCLRELLVRRLKERDPGLSVKISRLGPGQMQLLCEQIRQGPPQGGSCAWVRGVDYLHTLVADLKGMARQCAVDECGNSAHRFREALEEIERVVASLKRGAERP